MTHHYFAYGANTNLDSMAIRCPGAVALGVATLYDCQLVFRRHCDVESKEDAAVQGVLWHIDDYHLQSLDQFEGYPTYYERDKVLVYDELGDEYEAWVYYMTESDYLAAPSSGYWNLVREGYMQNGIDTQQLDQALEQLADGAYDKN